MRRFEDIPTLKIFIMIPSIIYRHNHGTSISARVRNQQTDYQ